MAPALLESLPVAAQQLLSPLQKGVDVKIFPDGIKTSGQHPPTPSALRPYSEFPKQITGKTVWRAEDYTNNPERWVHRFTAEEIEELSEASDKFIADGTPLTGISQVWVYGPDSWHIVLTITEHIPSHQAPQSFGIDPFRSP